MGMFDYVVDYEMYCPMCGVRVSDFQSKSAGCTLAQLSPAALAAEADPGIEYGVEFYSDCESCGTWITVKYRRYLDPQETP